MKPNSGSLPVHWQPATCSDLGRLPDCQAATDLRAPARAPAGSPEKLAAWQSAHVKSLLITGSLPGSLPPVAVCPGQGRCADLLDMGELASTRDLVMGDAGRLLHALQDCATRADLDQLASGNRALQAAAADPEQAGPDWADQLLGAFVRACLRQLAAVDTPPARREAVQGRRHD